MFLENSILFLVATEYKTKFKVLMKYILWPQILWFGVTYKGEFLLDVSPQTFLYSMIQGHALYQVSFLNIKQE